MNTTTTIILVIVILLGLVGLFFGVRRALRDRERTNAYRAEVDEALTRRTPPPRPNPWPTAPGRDMRPAEPRRIEPRPQPQRPPAGFGPRPYGGDMAMPLPVHRGPTPRFEDYTPQRGHDPAPSPGPAPARHDPTPDTTTTHAPTHNAAPSTQDNGPSHSGYSGSHGYSGGHDSGGSSSGGSSSGGDSGGGGGGGE